MLKKIFTAVIAAAMVIPINASADDADNLMGDINFDNKIDASDATEVLLEYSALSVGGAYFDSIDQSFVADINADNKVDAADATQILETYSYNSVHSEPMMPVIGFYFCNVVYNKKPLTFAFKTYDEALQKMKSYESPHPDLKADLTYEIYKRIVIPLDSNGMIEEKDFLVIKYKP